MLAPVLLFIAIWIKLDSTGPVFYRGVRIGRFGKPFRIFKFRTMVVNAEMLGGTSTAENDSRLTSIGYGLRKYKLDELPQLFNVLKGEMSFVGPRPEVEEYTSLYSKEEMQILDVPPGITDYASIRFRNLNTILARTAKPDLYYKDVIRPEKNRLRLEYARHNNLWIDLKILMQTAFAVLFKKD